MGNLLTKWGRPESYIFLPDGLGPVLEHSGICPSAYNLLMHVESHVKRGFVFTA